MKRPVIKDVEVRRYVEYLESKVQAIDTDSIKAESYKSLRKFITNNNVLLNETAGADASDKDDKLFDRAFKYADNLQKYLDTLEKIYDGLGEKYVEEVDKESASMYEKALRG